MTTAADVLVDGQNVDKGLFRSFLESLQLRYPLAAPNSETWGYSSSSPVGGAYVQLAASTSGPSPGEPMMFLQSHYQADNPVAVDFAGAYLGSVPLGLYVEHVQTGTNTSNDAGTHSIMAYGVNNASGNNDVVAVSGRVRKVSVAGGVGDACGVWGSAYSESSVRSGGVMGMEAHIYQNAGGMTADDRLNADWSVGIHVYSDSLGSPAKAGIGIDASGQTPGRYGFWNGIIIDKNCFAGGHIEGTVGINCASWDSYNLPQFGWKVGGCWDAQIYGVGQPFTIRADDSIHLNVNAASSVQAGGSSVFVELGTGAVSNLVVKAGGSSIFEILGADGSVHIKTGTTIKADL